MGNKVNGKSMVKKIWYLCLILIVVQFLLAVFFGLEILINDINAKIIMLVLVLIVLILPTYFFDYNKNKVDKKIYLVFTIIAVMIILFYYLFCFSSDKYFYFNSPYENSKRVLIVDETSFLFSGEGYFYERKNIIFIKRIDQSINYDGNPFSNGEATIKWLDENSIQVDYINNSVGHHNIEIVKFN